MKFKFLDKYLYIDNLKVVFKAPITTLIELNHGVIVLLAPISNQSERNIFFVNLDGSIKWQIEQFDDFDGGYKGFTSISIDANGTLQAYSFKGILCKINIDNGTIYEKAFTK